jgi:hypothetical protein
VFELGFGLVLRLDIVHGGWAPAGGRCPSRCPTSDALPAAQWVG